MSDIIVVGSGPAGVSAALYALRGGTGVTLVAKDGGALMRAAEIENYYGFPEVISGEELVQNGIAQAKRLGAQLLEEEVVDLAWDDGTFTVKTPSHTLTAPAVVLATGASRARPDIAGLADFEGHGVSYCAVCDAFFYRGKDVAVLGSGEYAVHEAVTLLPVAKSVTMLTNGAPVVGEIPEEIVVNEKEIVRFTGEDTLSAAEFKDGSRLEVQGLFIAIGVAGSGDLAKKLGAAADGNRIVVDENTATSVPGLFAAGDCTGGLLQVAKAVYEGAKAGIEAVRHVRKPGIEKLPLQDVPGAG